MKLFDLDGTLIDSNGVWREVDYRFLEAHGLKATDEYMAAVGQSIFPIAAKFTKSYYRLDMSPEAIMFEWMTLVKEAYTQHIPLKPGVKEYLMLEAARGETLALVTACVPALGNAVLERHGISDLFHHKIFAQELHLEKRDPRFFHQVIDLLNVSPRECIFYDDSPDNCAVAKSMGMTVVGILDPLYADDAPRMKRLCDRCVTDFTEFFT